MKPRRTVDPRLSPPDRLDPVEVEAWRHLIASVQDYAAAVAALERLTIERQPELAERTPDPVTGVAPADFARARLAIAEATCARARAASEQALRALDAARRTAVVRRRPAG